MPLPLAVLVSGGGSNLQAIIDRIEAGALDARIHLVLSNNPAAKALERARVHGLPTAVLPHQDFPSRAEFDKAVLDAVAKSGAEAVVLAGFMRLLPAEFIRAFRFILNIHPALLPAFPGLHAQRQAVEYGVRLAGCTVHFVDENVDTGPIIIQAALAVPPDESPASLSARILALEHRIYPQAIHWLAQDRLAIHGRHVALTGTGSPAPQPAGCLVSPALEAGF